ncbi:hypothetical protein LMG29739_02167 [Paraburkholderia solisilvae]|uniref:Uncharacterized protein n=1 Tax=Paraburkholderia solisilvae TaxID=624376 RepID=A0A6J5DMF1_9BURK|nr:hypothetical protein LMG29739_02167 [Paraburkholderia solisilvae]
MKQKNTEERKSILRTRKLSQTGYMQDETVTEMQVAETAIVTVAAA